MPATMDELKDALELLRKFEGIFDRLGTLEGKVSQMEQRMKDASQERQQFYFDVQHLTKQLGELKGTTEAKIANAEETIKEMDVAIETLLKEVYQMKTQIRTEILAGIHLNKGEIIELKKGR